ncbi:pilin [Vibrio sp. JC009]|nr:pilin [Vibrio sp. JC009]
MATLHNLKVPIEDHILTNGAFPEINSPADLLSLLGASETPLGAVTARQNDSQLQSGQIILNLSGTQFRESGGEANNLALERSESGNWRCITDIAQEHYSLFPKGCERGEIL